MIYIRLDIVNKYEYQENDNYKEIKILLPRDSEDLKKDFDYLGLNYKFLDIKDTHIKECLFICKEDPMFASNITDETNRLIARASELGYTTPFNEMKKFYESVNNLDTTDRDKLLAILQVKEDYIENITDALKCFEELEKYYLDIDSFDESEFAGNQIRLGDLYMEDVLPYINMRALGKDLIRERNARVTKYGVLCPMDIGREKEKSNNIKLLNDLKDICFEDEMIVENNKINFYFGNADFLFQIPNKTDEMSFDGYVTVDLINNKVHVEVVSITDDERCYYPYNPTIDEAQTLIKLSEEYCKKDANKSLKEMLEEYNKEEEFE